MNAVATYLLLKLKNPEADVTKDQITNVLNVAGAEVDEEAVDRLIAAMAEKNLDELLEEGYKKLVNIGGGGGGGGGGGAGAAGPAAAAVEEEEEEEEADESVSGGGGGLFGDESSS